MDNAADSKLLNRDPVLAQVNRILESPQFVRSGQLRRLFHYLVTETLAGRADGLTGCAIALDVLNRGCDFDPSTDPVVRSEARRLRQKLDEFYLTGGINDPIVIQIPKGSYVPVWSLREPPASAGAISSHHNDGGPCAVTAQGAPAERRQVGRRLGSRWTAAVSIALFLAAMLIFVQFASRGTDAAAGGVATWEPLKYLTAYPGAESDASISPDGNMIAFTRRLPAQEQSDIWVRSIDVENGLQITANPANDGSPSWSPDGRLIAFVRRLPGLRIAQIILVPPLGGSERVLAQFPSGWSSRLAWSPGGESIALPEGRAGGDVGGISLTSVHTGNVRRIVRREFAGAPAFSSDGARLVYFAVGTIYSIGRDGLDERILVSGVKQFAGLAMCPSGSGVMYIAQGALWRVPLEGGGSEFVRSLSPNAANPAYGPKGVLLYDEAYNQVDTLLLNWARKDIQIRPAITSSRADTAARFSPDGTRIAFVSDRTGTEVIWTARVDGSGEKPLTGTLARSSAPSWSPDGSSVVFHTHVHGGMAIFSVDANSGTLRRITESVANDTRPSFSPDGNWIYFGSNRSGAREVWKVPTAGEVLAPGSAVQVTSDGGFCPAVSADGKYVYYSKTSSNGGSPNQNSIWRQALSGGKAHPVVEPVVADPCGWSIESDGLYFISRVTDRTADLWAIYRVALSGGRTSLVSELPFVPHLNGGYGFDARAEQSQALIPVVSGSDGALITVRNLRCHGKK